jgi:hypothetical protein
MSNIESKYECLGPILGYTYQWNNIWSGVYFQQEKKNWIRKIYHIYYEWIELI